MRQRRQTQKSRKPNGKRPAPQKNRTAAWKNPAERWRASTDEKYKDTRMMSVEERKAAQLAKWRKELGLD